MSFLAATVLGVLKGVTPQSVCSLIAGVSFFLIDILED